MYCRKCKRLLAVSRCPVCGGEVDAPSPDDWCFLIEKEPVWAEMLEEVLKDNGIPFITQSRLGAAMALKLGLMMERIDIFVPYKHYKAASEYVIVLFSSESDGEENEDHMDRQIQRK